MPDDDKLPRSLSARWRRVLKAFRAGESQEAIEHHVAKAAAETLRGTHGVPELPALGAQMYLDATTGYGADGSSRRALSAHIPTRHRFEDIAQSNPRGELAKRLLAHPDGTGLRASGRRQLKLVTADLMDVDIEEML
jgi:hypothetical protein